MVSRTFIRSKPILSRNPDAVTNLQDTLKQLGCKLILTEPMPLRDPETGQPNMKHYHNLVRFLMYCIDCHHLMTTSVAIWREALVKFRCYHNFVRIVGASLD